MVVTSSKDGADSILDRELHDPEIVISQPFWPAYMTTLIAIVCRKQWKKSWI